MLILCFSLTSSLNIEQTTILVIKIITHCHIGARYKTPVRSFNLLVNLVSDVENWKGHMDCWCIPSDQNERKKTKKILHFPNILKKLEYFDEMLVILHSLLVNCHSYKLSVAVFGFVVFLVANSYFCKGGLFN